MTEQLPLFEDLPPQAADDELEVDIDPGSGALDELFRLIPRLAHRPRLPGAA